MVCEVPRQATETLFLLLKCVRMILLDKSNPIGVAVAFSSHLLSDNGVSIIAAKINS